MLSLFSAILQHLFRMGTYTHDGSGLPSKRGGGLYTVAVAAGVSQLVLDAVAPGGLDMLNSVAANLAYIGLMLVFLRPPPMAAALLANLLGNLANTLLLVTGATFPFASQVIVVWEVTALLVTLTRWLQRAQPANNESTKKN